MEYADAEIIMNRAYEALDWHYQLDHGLSPYGSIALREALMGAGVPNLEANEHIKRCEPQIDVFATEKWTRCADEIWAHRHRLSIV